MIFACKGVGGRLTFCFSCLAMMYTLLCFRISEDHLIKHGKIMRLRGTLVWDPSFSLCFLFVVGTTVSSWLGFKHDIHVYVTSLRCTVLHTCASMKAFVVNTLLKNNADLLDLLKLITLIF